MSVTSESNGVIMLENMDDPPSVDDANTSGNMDPNCILKKGPWTSAEDAVLIDYVTKHGEGNWNAVQKHTGLSRCGKSCRLRWTNHLRPNLKKGAFSPEEERLIIELHAKIGNKWARMATELPGRTDNEIKNFWNTRMKRQQRAGLPIYPPDVAKNKNQGGDDLNSSLSGDLHNPDLMPVKKFDIPTIEFKGLQGLYPRTRVDFQVCCLPTDVDPNKSLYLSKRFCGPEPAFSCVSASMVDPFFADQFESDESVQMGQRFGLLSPYDHMELPSLQTQIGSWGSSTPSASSPHDILFEAPHSNAFAHESGVNNYDLSNPANATTQDLHGSGWEDAYDEDIYQLERFFYSENPTINGDEH